MLDDASTFQPIDDIAGMVRQHQEELLRAAYLLTGDEERASKLSEDALLAMLRSDARRREDDDRRRWLLRTLAASYLNAPHAPRESTPIFQPSAPADVMRFHVEDERSRLWAALERCDPPQRLALVYRDFNQLDEEAIADLTHWTPYELRQRLAAGRERLRDAAGSRSEQPAQALLLSLSFGAPRVDLWSRLEEPARRMEERERRRRHVWTGGIATALLATLAAGIIWLGGGLSDGDGDGARAQDAPASVTPLASPTSAEPTATVTPLPERSAAHVPNFFLLGGSESSVAWLAGATGSMVELHGAPEQAALSADGRRLVYASTSGHGDTEETWLTALDPISAQLAWWRTAAGVIGQPVVAGELFIVVEQRPSRSSAPLLAAYDLETGTEVSRWKLEPHLDLGGWGRQDEVHLYASPDGAELRVVTFQINEVAALVVRGVRRYGLPELTLLETVELGTPIVRGRWGPSFDFQDAHLLPDGSGLYSLPGDDSAEVRIFDFATAEVSLIELPATGATAQNPWRQASAVTSHAGDQLFLITYGGDVALIDLRERRLARTFPIDQGGVASPVSDAVGWRVDQQGGVFSNDGSRLYLMHAFEGASVSNDPDAVSVIWVIDVAEWRVLQEWRVPGLVRMLALGADDEHLLIATRVADAELPYRIFEIETAGGTATDVSADFGVAPGAGELSFIAMRQLYQAQYGTTPALSGDTPSDLAQFATLPLIDLQVERKVLAPGGQALFDVRLLDPSGRATVQASSRRVRFDPAATVTLTLSHPERDDIIIFPLELDTGIYRAGVPLPEVGAWSATVAVSYPDGTRWERSWPGLVQVNPTFQASDGRAYILSFNVNPELPAVDEDVRVTASFVDVESGAQLPPEVALELGLPDVMSVVFRRADGAFRAATLEPSGHGFFVTSASFRWSGFWQAEVSFRAEDDDSTITLPMGVWEVVSGSGE